MSYRYIGSKARIADCIIEHAGAPAPGSRFVDLMCGTGCVATAAANIGWAVTINDMMYSSAIIAESRLLSEQDVPFVKLGGYEQALIQLNGAFHNGFIWEQYSPASMNLTGKARMYFTEENAARVDGMRNLIHEWRAEDLITPTEFVLLMATLLTAVNSVANIAGTYGCFLSAWTSNSLRSIRLSPLALRRTQADYRVFCTDASQVPSTEKDVVYIDPPYTKRQYAAYYHIPETIAQGDTPAVAGVTGLRPWKERASVFCYKKKALNALIELIRNQEAHCIYISYSSEGHVRLEDLRQELECSGSVRIIELGMVGRYRPNTVASRNGSEVAEFLIEYRKDTSHL